ncbi:MAG: YdcF family protein [Coriobacteriia bacterium]|nr:YdcF family protein [Coriobacteriia bacterium]
MNQHARRAAVPTRGLWRRFLILIPLVAIMAVGCYLHIRSVCDTYQAWTPVTIEGVDYGQLTLDDVSYSNPGVVEAIDIERGLNGAAGVTFRAVAPGETDVTFGNDQLATYWHMAVRDGAIIFAGVSFSGWESIHLCLCVLFGVLAALFGSVVVRLQRTHWFGYGMVASCGGMLFCLFQCALFTYIFVNGSLVSFGGMLYQITVMADYFVMITLIPMAVAALLVSISNIALIRHEGLRPVNLLGIAASLLWVAATFFWLQWWYLAANMALPVPVMQFADSVIAVAMTYGECLLAATILCAWIASRTAPRRHMDYLVVLGCGIRPDGTPSPLLAGRVDRAREFDAARIAAGEAPATFVPSGGQGPDEVMSEAQSMRDYLVARGVDPERIVLEDRSTTTRENMAFSRQVIEQHAGRDANEVAVGFSTTNYHVFRGYVCAHQAGMAVAGMGSKTRAYFWPNAFLREFVGLLAGKWKGILVTYVVIAAIYAFAEYVLSMM